MTINETRGGWLASLSQFVAWIITSILAVMDMLFIREAILAGLAWFRVIETAAYRRAGGVGEDIFTGFGISAFDNVMLVLLGLAALSACIYFEYYFRKGRPQGLLYRRIGKVLLIEVVVIVVALLLKIVISSIVANMPA